MSRQPKEVRRLDKTVKRRRQYAEALRASAVQTRREAQTLSGALQDAETAFADRLDAMADAELLAARESERQARDLKMAVRTIMRPVDPRLHPERAEAATAVLTERGSRARLMFVMDHLGLDVAGMGSGLDPSLAIVEDRQGTTTIVSPSDGPRMLMGARLALAETRAFGKPRF